MYTFDQAQVMISRMQIIVNPTHAIQIVLLEKETVVSE